MFIFSDSVAKNSTLSADVCVIGSGAASLAFLQKFLDSKSRICVLESGNFEQADNPDPLYQFEPTGLPIAPDSRVRVFGGTTALWAGCWKWHDAIDFSKRDWVPHSGWPIRREDIEPYYQQASRLLQAPYPQVDGESGFLRGSPIEQTAFVYQSRDRRHWGETFRNVIEASPTITVFLDAHVVGIGGSRRGVTEIQVRTAGGNAFTVNPYAAVLAAGGIENARLLLMSDIGNERGQVGRYYMDHPKGKVGTVEAYKPIDLSDYWDARTPAGRVRVGFRLSDETQERHRILNSHIFLEPLPARSLASKIVPALARSKKSPVIAVRNYLEQIPVASNRVYLGERRDSFGCPIAKIDWSISELDKRTIKVFHGLLQKELQRLGIGELNSALLDDGAPDFPITQDASHHMGTTRMGEDPATSVVNTNCKVHGGDNLFVAGSSVFTTSGYANPTATIAALALRLGDYVKQGL